MGGRNTECPNCLNALRYAQPGTKPKGIKRLQYFRI